MVDRRQSSSSYYHNNNNDAHKLISVNAWSARRGLEIVSFILWACRLLACFCLLALLALGADETDRRGNFGGKKGIFLLMASKILANLILQNSEDSREK
jgi:hypothetical protein